MCCDQGVFCGATLIACFRSKALARASLVVLVLIVNTGCANQVSYIPPNAAGSSGVEYPVIEIISPSHPRTFDVTGNDKLSQELVWDKKAKTLFANVTYSELLGGGDAELDPSNYETFELPFPTVELDSKNNLFVLDSQKERILLGHLEGAVFGPKVVLKSNVLFVAHRHNGELSAKITVNTKVLPKEPPSFTVVQVSKAPL